MFITANEKTLLQLLGFNTLGLRRALKKYHKTSMTALVFFYLVWLWYKQESFVFTPPKLQSLKFSIHHEKQVKNVMKTVKSHSNTIADVKIMLEETFTNKFESMFSEVELEGRVKYKGEMINGKREGKGINRWENGDKYVGE